jgi:hypothetical protein
MGEMTQARGLSLQTISDAMTFGKMMANSEFAPKDFRGKPESCVLAMQHGAELGLSPMQAIQSIAVVNGRPSLYGDTAKAICLAAPVCEWITETVEGDGETMVAICTAKRRGSPEPTVVQFSVADAKKAQLWGKSGPWTQYARRMLQMRARGFALRDAFPDVLRGLITAEEAQDYPTPEPVREPVVIRTRATPQRLCLPCPDRCAPGPAPRCPPRRRQWHPSRAAGCVRPGTPETGWPPPLGWRPW